MHHRCAYFAYGGNPGKKFPIQTANTVATALQAVVAATHVTVVFQLNTTSIYVNPNNFGVSNFTGLSLTGLVCHINAATAPAPAPAPAPGVVGVGVGTGTGTGTGTGATSPTAAQVVAVATVTTNAANQELMAQQTAAAAALAATLPTKFNSNNLPPKAKARYENHLATTYLMTKTDIQPFPTSFGGVYHVLSYLDSQMGIGVT